MTDPQANLEDVYKLALPLLVERHGRIRKVAVQIDRTSTGLRLTIVHKGRPPAS